MSLQIGRPLRGRVLVAARCRLGKPSVMLTLPFEQRDGPMPPLLWLCCPELSREMGRLEGAGLAAKFEERLAADSEASAGFMETEEGFSRLWYSIAERTVGPDFAARLGRKGVAGGAPGLVKCLHAHLAYRLASGEGPVGSWCIEYLEKNSWECCGRIPEACVH